MIESVKACEKVEGEIERNEAMVATSWRQEGKKDEENKGINKIDVAKADRECR